MTGIITAMSLEAEAIKKWMHINNTYSQGGLAFFEGKIGSHEVILCQSGVGKVAAAMACTMLAEKKPDLIINCGVAGGLQAGMNCLDIAVADEVIQADYDTSALDGEEGLGKRFKTDETYRKKALEILEKEKNGHSFVAAIASQDLFVARESDVNKIKTRFPAAAVVEMEAGAIGQVCEAFGIPFLVIRSLSDTGDSMEFETFAGLAAKQSAAFVKELLK